MSKIYIVTFVESFDDYGREDEHDDILKAFKSLDGAKEFLHECYNARIEELKEAGANIEDQEINDDSGWIHWVNHEAGMNGITDYIILERELAD